MSDDEFDFGDGHLTFEEYVEANLIGMRRLFWRSLKRSLKWLVIAAVFAGIIFSPALYVGWKIPGILPWEVFQLSGDSVPPVYYLVQGSWVLVVLLLLGGVLRPWRKYQ